ncbi:TNT domain-containing protein [Amycolatopsis nigrescens]|uniref:TNT domain-containing protein n=1 Tax=Amycolatopsis nigrescens TaxID=381445 RepID=UPI00036A9E8A|nr:TNT domain-containing protein [Amycolatopsis nigrescens]
MGIDLPQELADVAAKAGLSWPEADEDAMRAQATAWREARERLLGLTGDADAGASTAVSAMSGPAGEAAGRLWSGFADPDDGQLSTAARGAGEAADRLEHAAEQVGTAKVEMVRQLVDVAKNADAADAAASAGHPSALLGLDSALRGAGANLTAVTDGLAGAVGPAAGAPVAAVTELVNPNPGAHTAQGQSGLLSAVTGLPAEVVSTVDNVAAPVAKAAEPVLSTVDNATGPVVRAAEPVLSTVDDVARPVVRAAEPVMSTVDEVVERVPDRLGDASPGHFTEAPPGHLGDTGTALRPTWDEGTGPIRLGGPPVPAQYGGFLDAGGFDDVPTPSAGLPLGPPGGVPTPAHGTTSASGFTDAAFSAPPSAAPAGVPPLQGVPAGGAPAMGAPPFGGPPAGYGPPPVAGSPMAPMAPMAPQAPAAPVAPPVPGVQAGYGSAAPARQTGVRWGPEQPPAYPGPRADPAPPRPAPAPAPPPAQAGTPRQERESLVALFLVHMFPIGHLPVAADRPQRQLPAPSAEVDYVVGLRFEPHDHPESARLDSAEALARVRDGWSRLATPPAEPPAELIEGHDPLGGLHERDWDRRYLGGVRASVPEYAWPPGELYPEGGYEAGVAEMLAEGTLLDRFGDVRGRVFAPAGTPFAQRSLPPSHREAGYRKYRVLREVPMWRAISAAWFGQPGGGVRYRAVYTADELVSMGYLADVTFPTGSNAEEGPR